MKSRITSFIKSIPDRLMDRHRNKLIINSATYLILAVVSYAMTIINLFTNVGELKYVTLIFGVLCTINLVVVTFSSRTLDVVAFIFAFELIGLFTYFIVSGNPHGFSIIWITLLPAISMLFYGLKRGCLISGIMFLILIFFLWIPAGFNLVSEEAKEGYSTVFRLRFPFLYLAGCAVAIILSLLQNLAYNAVDKARFENKYIMFHDQLTNIYNRMGFREEVIRRLNKSIDNKVGFSIIDVDKFKYINDTFGHNAGDEVLVTFARLMKENLNAIPCRWGGDEFAMVYFGSNVTKQNLEEFRQIVNEYKFNFNGEEFHMTISVGVFEVGIREIQSIEGCMNYADDALYQSKENGKNQITYY